MILACSRFSVVVVVVNKFCQVRDFVGCRLTSPFSFNGPRMLESERALSLSRSVTPRDACSPCFDLTFGERASVHALIRGERESAVEWGASAGASGGECWSPSESGHASLFANAIRFGRVGSSETSIKGSSSSSSRKKAAQLFWGVFVARVVRARLQ